MGSSREGQKGEVPVSPRVIHVQAWQTIQTLPDAIVELVTNADDSYRRLVEKRGSPSGEIKITVIRRKQGGWERLEVADKAEGMDLQRLLEIIEFGGKKSGFEMGRSVRGLFGRGLKEAILALGEGVITSIKDGEESSIKVWWDEAEEKARWEILKDSREADGPNGTTVVITPRKTGKKVKCPTFEKLCQQVSQHFALRDICSDKNRQVFLEMENLGGLRGRGAGHSKLTTQLHFEPPAIVRSEERKIRVEGLGECLIKINESAEQLAFNQSDPYSLAGLLVKTEGASLDLSLFGFEGRNAVYYFFGEVYCPGIASKIREGERGLVDSGRSGLRWQNPLCKNLWEEVRKILKLYVERKERELESNRTPSATPEEVKKKLQNVCQLLNRWAREELESPPTSNGDNGAEPDEITQLTIIPEKGHSEPGKPRTFSVYLPRSRANQDAPRVRVELQDISGRVWLRQPSVPLERHKKHKELLMGHFEVTGENEGDRAYIVARWSSEDDIAEFEVRAPGTSPKGDKPRRSTGGMFRDFEFDPTDGPFQRVFYDKKMGLIKIFIKFPPLESYLGQSGEGAKTQKGSVLLAELVCEAFCRVVAREKLMETPAPTGGEVDQYNSLVNDLMRKYSKEIHKALVVHELSAKD